VGEIQRTGNLQQRLFQPLQKGLEQTNTQTQALRTAFDTAAGPSRTFEGIGGQNQLEGAIKAGGIGAEGLIGASYGGPSGLSPEDTAKLQDALNRVSTRTGSYQRPGELATYVQQSTGVNPGMARYDAAILSADKPFQESVKGLSEAQGASQKALEAQQAQTTAFAKQRAQEEAAIASKAQEYLQGQGTNIMGDLAKRVAEAQAKNQTASTAYDAFKNTGDISTLTALDPSMLGFDPNTLTTDRDKLAFQASQAKQTILNDPMFASIKDVPLMTLGINNHGVEVKKMDPEWEAANKSKYPPSVWNAIVKQASLRQDKLRDAGFAYKYKYGGATGVAADPGETKGGKTQRKDQMTAGQYSELDPLYFGTPWEGVDQSAYLNPLTTINPNEQMMSTAEERARYNAIQNMLGGNGMDTPGVLYSAPTIGYDLEGFKAAEDAMNQDRVNQEIAAQNEWQRRVGKSRKKYKERKASSWGGSMKNMRLADMLSNTIEANFGPTHRSDVAGSMNPPTTTAQDYGKKKETK
jgi:hypothetical protein